MRLRLRHQKIAKVNKIESKVCLTKILLLSFINLIHIHLKKVDIFFSNLNFDFFIEKWEKTQFFEFKWILLYVSKSVHIDRTLFIFILTFFAHTFFYKQLDLRLLETMHQIFCWDCVSCKPSVSSGPWERLCVAELYKLFQNKALIYYRKCQYCQNWNHFLLLFL